MILGGVHHIDYIDKKQRVNRQAAAVQKSQVLQPRNQQANLQFVLIFEQGWTNDWTIGI